MELNSCVPSCICQLWDTNVTWNTEIPDFTPCFQNVVLVAAPNVLFWFAAIFSLQHTKNCKHVLRPFVPLTLLYFAKLVLCFLFFSIGVAELFFSIFSDYLGYICDIRICIGSIKIFSSIFVLFMLLQHRAYGIKSSSVLSWFWLMSTFGSAIICRSTLLSVFSNEFALVTVEKYFLDTFYFVVVLFQFILSLFTDNGGIRTMKSSPLDDEPFFSIVSFHWFNRIILKSTRKLLEFKDFPPLTPNLKAKCLWLKFNSVWCRKIAYVAALNDESKDEVSDVIIKQTSVPSLALALMRAFWPWIVLASVLELCFDIMRFFAPLVMNLIIDFTSSDEYLWRGYFYAMLMFFSYFVSSCVLNMTMFYLSALSLQFKSSLLSAIYRKALKLSNSTRTQYTTGEMVNLMAVDVDKVFNFTLLGTLTFGAPIRVILTIVFLWQYLGPACLAGSAVILVVVPLSALVGRFNHSVQVKQMQTKDLRLKHMNEILNGIKVLKLCAWEIPFMKNIEQIRKKEVKLIRTFQFCYAVSVFMWSCSPFFVAVASFITYVMISDKNILDPSTAFVSLSLINMLRFSLFLIPDLLSSFVQTNISLGRLRTFLLSEERETSVGNMPDKGQVISIKEANFSWGSTDQPAMKNINLSIPEGSLVAIIGQVGSGKSSLLSAILGDMHTLAGFVDLKGETAYVPQQAWILNQTLRQNIIFTKRMDTEKYQNILINCSLEPDLEILPGGDMTEIGERGINLSGGQKQRISLARAVFQDADIYLLDDPLSAVDSHVGRHLFDHVIGPKGMLNCKTRVLVTHNISVLPEVDFIVSMKDGSICEIGTYKDLINKNGAFAEFMKDHNQTVAEEDEDIDKITSIVDYSIAEKSQSNLSLPLILRATSVESISKTRGAQLMEEERMEVGKVKRKVYVNYLQHASFLFILLTVFGYLCNASLEIAASIWLSKWTSDIPLPDGTQDVPMRNMRIVVYVVIGTAQALAMMFGTIMLTLGAAKASKQYHQRMLQSVMRSPMSFFDATPLGRILNRFGKDIDVIDTEIPVDFDGWLSCVLAVLGTCVVIGMNTPLFLVTLVPISVVFYLIQKMYLNTSRQIKRLDSTTRSPIYSHFSETVQGVTSIRAYNAENEFVRQFEEKIDTNVSCYFHWVCSNRWLAFRLDVIGNLVLFAVCVLAVVQRSFISGAVAGLSITYALSMTDSLTWMIRTWTELENKLVSVERIDEYSTLPSEAPWIIESKQPPELWPTKGSVSFKNYSTRYRENLDLVLTDICLDISSNEKIGIVGRTGAGKSSITLSLFRVIEAVKGKVTVDEIDISSIGLHSLRSKLTIIPQDPVLFTGTVRMNLDPSSNYSDEELWTSLEHAYLKSFVSSLSEGLDYNIAEGGENLSVGQRQLICLARALLKNTKILVLDEATAAVDMETDSLIQRTIREKFEEYTVITIAHRLHTIMDYNRVVVMDSGRIIEVGKPSDLLQDSGTKFFSMAKDAGLV